MALKKKKSPKKKVAGKRPVRKLVKKKAVRKIAKKGAIKKTSAPKIKEKIIGKVTHYFPKVRAAVIKLSAPLSIGDAIRIKGHTTDFTQAITSLQIDRLPINSAKKGDEIGLLVNSRVRAGDTAYKA